jgi:hypothetical protein
MRWTLATFDDNIFIALLFVHLVVCYLLVLRVVASLIIRDDVDVDDGIGVGWRVGLHETVDLGFDV